jgi:hypothetical protein
MANYDWYIIHDDYSQLTNQAVTTDLTSNFRPHKKMNMENYNPEHTEGKVATAI